jgi:hypothetical protein
MRGIFKNILVGAAAIAAVMFCGSAHATNVTYTITGAFNGQTAASTNTLSGVAGQSITFTAGTFTYDAPPGGPQAVDFGTFALTGTSTSSTLITGNTFTLTLKDGNTNQTLTESVDVNFEGNQVLSDVFLTAFSPAGLLFTPDYISFAMIPPGDQIVVPNTNTPVQYDGTATAVPLPRTATAGFSLLTGLGCLVGFGKLRRRHTSSIA